MMAWDFVMVFATSVTGVITAIVRFVMACGVTFFALQRMDASCFPGWVDHFVQLDGLAKSYRSVLVTFHIHNNPTMHVFLWVLQQEAADRRDAPANGMLPADSPKLRAAKRWRKAVICVMNPLVAAERSGLTLEEVKERDAPKKKRQSKGGDKMMKGEDDTAAGGRVNPTEIEAVNVKVQVKVDQ